MELDFQERLDKHLKSLDDLQRFKVSIENPFPDKEFKGQYQDRNTINLCENCHDYADNISDTIDDLKKFLLDVLEDIIDPTLQKHYIETVYDKIVELEFDESATKYIDKAEAKYTKLNKTEEYNYPWQMAVHHRKDDWDAQLAKAAVDYLKINDRLHEVISYVLLKGGYKISEQGELKGPLDAEQFIKRRFTTNLDVYKLGMFLQLCIDSDIIQPKGSRTNSSKTAVARMISENFVKEDGDHFTFKSLKNKMKLHGSNKTSEENKQELLSLLDKMKALLQ